MKLKYILLLPLLLGLASCSKFLEEYSRDQKYVETTDDLNKLMIGEAFIKNVDLSIYSQATMGSLTRDGDIAAPWLHVMDDDSEEFVVDFVNTDQATPLYILGGFHHWAQAPAVDVRNFAWDDVMWRRLYKRIGALSAILFQASTIAEKSPNDVELRHIRGEAYFLRAYYYFLLQNIYGSPYRVSSASTDEGVPLKVSEKVEDRYFNRDKNADIYRQIIDDLDQASQDLAGYHPDTKLRVGLAAVKALQSRVYLYTEQYDKVLDVTKDFDSFGYSLSDLNQYTPNTNFTSRKSSETIFTMGSNVIAAVFMNDSLSAWNGDDRRASAFKASTNLIDSYDQNDLRLNTFFKQSTKAKAFLPAKYRTWSTYQDPEQVSCLFSLRYAEVILNRAEAYAMRQADADAKTEVNKLRAARFKNATVTSLPNSHQELVEFLREERRRELCFEGHRWFDLRRYAVNSAYPLAASFSIKHPTYTYDPQSKTHTLTGHYVLRSLTQDGPAWQMPIPNYAIEFNRGALTNPIRVNRSIQPL